VLSGPLVNKLMLSPDLLVMTPPGGQAAVSNPGAALKAASRQRQPIRCRADRRRRRSRMNALLGPDKNEV
jgi:hypothetical protein